jgi:hypothetical protein
MAEFTSQLFRRPIDKDQMNYFLSQICLKTDRYFLVNRNAYNKLIFLGLVPAFLSALRPFYHESRQHFVDESVPFTFNRFNTLIRQYVRSHSHEGDEGGIKMVSHVRYVDKVYSMEYLLYYVEPMKTRQQEYDDDDTW